MLRDNERRRINIMSSCDEDYARLVPVQLHSIAESLVAPRKYDVHYYFFHSRVEEETLALLESNCEALGIAFHNVRITDTELYKELASKGGSWAYEAYYALECHVHLHSEIDRVMYIDAADVLIIGDIGEYYFSDFEDCSIIATSIRYKSDGNGGVTAMENDDLCDNELRLGILRGIFNSGSYIMNLDKMRRENLSLADYVCLKDALSDIYPDKEQIYFGDQGLLAAAFVGDIKYYGYPEITNLWYQPYNFCIWFFDRAAEICSGNPWYVPRILHFAGGKKPWELTSENEAALKPGQWPYYKLYQLYHSRVVTSHV